MMNLFNRIFRGNVEGQTFGAAQIKRAGVLSVSAVFMMATLSSCFVDSNENPVVEPEKGYVSISLIVPGQTEDPIEEITRHGNTVAGEGDENKIKTLTFFAFKGDNSFELSKTIEINPDDNSSSDPMWNKDRSSLRLLLTIGAKKIYVVANWSITPTTEMPSITGIQTIADLNNQLRYHNGIMPGIPPVMTGYREITLVGGEQGIEVELTRQIARVDVYPMISTNVNALNATVTVEGIKFINMAQRSYLFPHSASPTTGTWSQTNFQGSSTGALTSVYGANGVISPPPTRYGRYYLPEHFGTAAAHTIMVIHGTYNDIDTYYFIDINGQSNAEPSLYAVERNHSYRYNVIIQGIGSSSPTPVSSGGSSFDPGIANIAYELDII